MPDDPDQANQLLVDRLIAEGALWSAAVIAAFRATPRHHFLDRAFVYQRKTRRWREVLLRDPGPAEIDLLYSDKALITHVSPAAPDDPGMAISSSSQPSLMAQMIEDLRLSSGQRVLEIGAGTGYNAALLAHVAGPGRVTSVDVDRGVLSEAWDHLRKFPERQVELKYADGRDGIPERAPFDRIMVTAATPDLEPAWLEQLAEGGLLVAPLTLAPGLAFVIRGTAHAGRLHGRLTRAAYFMPLRAEGQSGREDEPAPPPVGRLELMPAPWQGWFDRPGMRLGWASFIQALAFHAWLRGLEVHYQTLIPGETTFGVGSGEQLCWLGADSWHISGNDGRALGEQLWQSFLDAGGPWPTDYRVLMGPHLPPQAPGERPFVRAGPRCHQQWRLREPRNRVG